MVSGLDCRRGCVGGSLSRSFEKYIICLTLIRHYSCLSWCLSVWDHGLRETLKQTLLDGEVGRGGEEQ